MNRQAAKNAKEFKENFLAFLAAWRFDCLMADDMIAGNQARDMPMRQRAASESYPYF
jgi:hypothetical protein